MVHDLSKTRKRDFKNAPICSNEEFWFKAQKLQGHFIKYGDAKYLFANKNLYEQEKGFTVITKDHTLRHLNALNAASFTDYEQDRILYIYDDHKRVCECKNFWHLGYCKHFLAVKIYLE